VQVHGCTGTSWRRAWRLKVQTFIQPTAAYIGKPEQQRFTMRSCILTSI